jgi:glucokinase
VIPADAPVLALDLGGTQVRAAVVASDGRVLASRRSRTPVEAGGPAIVAACLAALGEVRDLHTSTGGRRPLAGVGISAPGPVDPFAGVILDPPNLGPTFHDTPLARLVGEAFGLPAVLDRDTQVAALAEGRFGAARGCGDFLYLTVSTGVGGAIVSGGRLIRGPDGTAGELGHLLVDRDGAPCGCGVAGHLEGIASGSGVARSARRAAERGESALLAELVRARGDAFGGRDVAEAEDAGDAVAAGIMADAREAFALACVSLADIFDPELIVVGGSVAVGQGERLLGPAREAVSTLAFRRPAARARIVAAALGDDVGLTGAAELVRERLG